jgi:methanogenic corrinoid protein MtbC1
MPDVEAGGFEGLLEASAHRTPSQGGRHASFEQLRQLVEGDLLPRLLLIHHAGPIPPRLAARAASVLPGGEYDRFLRLILGQPSDDRVTEFLEDLLDAGHSLDTVYVDLLTPAARQLGVLWSEDSCDFVEVTLACCQMQRVIRRISRRLVRARPDSGKGSVMVAALKDEQHTLGPILVAELLDQVGWDVRLGEPFQPVTDMTGVHLLAFSLARVDRWEEARDRIAELRALADRPIQVIVGGGAFLIRPGLVSRVGADGWAEDGKAVSELADRLRVA